MTEGLVLVRHCSTDANESGTLLSASDPPLSSRGAAQSEALQDFLAGHRPARLVSSPAVRAHQTALDIGRTFGLAVTVDTRLSERALGDWEGLSREQALERRAALGVRAVDLTQDWVDCPGVEQDRTIHERVTQVIETHGDDAAAGRLLMLVTHAGVIKAFVCTILGIPLSRPFPFRVTLGGVVVLNLRAGYWELNQVWPNPRAEPPSFL